MKSILTVFIVFGAWYHLYSFGEEGAKAEPAPEATQEAAPKAAPEAAQEEAPKAAPEEAQEAAPKAAPDEPVAELTEEEKNYNLCLASSVLTMYNHTNQCVAYAQIRHQQSGNSEPFSLLNHGAECFKSLAEYYIGAVEGCKNVEEEKAEPAEPAETTESENSEAPAASKE